MTPQKRYYLSASLRVALVVFGILMVIALLVLMIVMINLLFRTSYPFSLLLQIMMIAAALLGFAIIIAVFNVLMTRLTLSEVGIEHRRKLKPWNHAGRLGCNLWYARGM
jgi:hypothetical protein